jgi:hypothetical protein
MGPQNDAMHPGNDAGASAPDVPTRPPRRWPMRRSTRINRVVAAISWAGTLFVVAFAVRGWWIGQLTPDALVTLAAVGVGCALGGALALSGDGDVIFLTGADEAQREAIRMAATPAYSLAFLGLLLIWVGYEFWPAWRANVHLLMGLLLLLMMATYSGGYLWLRRRV